VEDHLPTQALLLLPAGQVVWSEKESHGTDR
jgi:hypothetical protein